MNLANPNALFWAALAIPIVVLYILKVRLRQVPVSTIQFWRQIFEEKQRRSLWQHLRHLVSLLVQLVLLALVVLAVTEPFFAWELGAARRLVLVIDNSASMNAHDIEPSRLERAKELARQIVAELRIRDEAAIVAAGTEPQLACGLTGHLRTLRDALDALPATDGPTRVLEAVALARRLLAGHENGRVIVLTDGCFDDAVKLTANPEVELRPIGQRTGNVAITRFQVRRSLLDPAGYEVLVEVANFSDDPVECRLQIDLNENVVDVYPLKLEADAKWRQVIEDSSAAGGRLVAWLDRPDALAADNKAWALLPPRALQPITLVTEGNWYLRKVFEASSQVRLRVVRELDAHGLPSVGVGAKTSSPITVLHRQVPSQLPPGPVWVIEPGGPCDLWQIGAKVGSPIVTKQDDESPLMAHVRLKNVILPEARRLKLLGKPMVLASGVDGEPLYAAFERKEGKVLVLTVDLDQGDLPLRTAFPILTSNALAWLAGNRGELREALATGSVVPLDLTDQLTEAGALPTLLLWPPEGEGRKLPPNKAKLTLGPLDRCGVWRVGPPTSGSASETAPPLEFACNLANARESDLRTPDALLAMAAPVATGSGWAQWPLWFYLLAAAGALAGLEWYLYQRRWIS